MRAIPDDMKRERAVHIDRSLHRLRVHRELDAVRTSIVSIEIATRTCIDRLYRPRADPVASDLRTSKSNRNNKDDTKDSLTTFSEPKTCYNVRFWQCFHGGDMRLTHRSMLVGVVVTAALTAWTSTATAATLCVSHAGGACFTTISAAVSAASPNDVIRVGRGTYHEDVVIGKALSLLGERAETVVIDATGLLNGINVDGHNHAGLAHVIVSGFTVQNALAQGILVTDASDVLVSDNHLTGNDQALDIANLECPPLPPYFQAGEAFDCGEAIHLSGVHHSIVSNNLVELNAGGILISDDTGPNHDNLITGNTVQDNPYDCGITIASHHFSLAPTDAALGIYHIVVDGNVSQRNGLITGEGAGVGIFAGPPGAQNNGDVITNNVLRGNALPGVAIHAHSPFQTMTDHQIVGNIIADNGPDSDPGTTVPTGISISSEVPPITGIVISQNVFKREDIDIVMTTPGGSSMEAHLNSLNGDVGVANYGAANISATANWWKCAKGPGARGCSAIDNRDGGTISVTPWLTNPSKN
jgi:parallel beta-helix repeat protein